MANGSYPPYSSQPYLSNSYSSWVSGTALGDFDGKANTEVIKSLDGYYRNMSIVLNTFNADKNQNQGYSQVLHT